MKKRFPHKLHSTRTPQALDAGFEGRAQLADLYIQFGLHDPRVQAVHEWLARLPAATLTTQGVKVPAVGWEPCEQLPAGYGYKGGGARYILARLLASAGLRAGAYPQAPRDLDLVRFGSGWSSTDTELSRRYMPHDYERGHGVEVISSWERYVESRDLSINELTVMDGELRCSVVCFIDTLARVLRPCRYRPGTLHRRPLLPSTLALKLVRMQQEYLALGEEWEIVGLPEDQDVQEFDIAVQVNKALARGTVVAERLLAALHERGWLDVTGYGSGALLIEYLREQREILPGGIHFFYHAAPELRMQVGDR